MKNLFSLLLAVATLAFVSSCGKKLSAEETAKKFVECLQNQDFKGAKAYADESTQKALDGMAANKATGTNNTKKGEIKSVECTTTGDADGATGDCSVCCNAGGGSSKVRLVNQKGKWLVNMTKEEMQKKESGSSSNPLDNIGDAIKSGLDSAANAVNDALKTAADSLKKATGHGGGH